MKPRELTRTRQQGTQNTNSNGDSAVKMQAIRTIVNQKQYAKIDGVMVDLFSASAIIAVYDALDPVNQAKFVALPIGKMAQIAFKLIK